MAEFDQRNQRVNNQINAENVTIYSGNNGDDLPEHIRLFLEKEIQKYLDMDFAVSARSNNRAILLRKRKTTLGDWFKFLKFLWKLITFSIKVVYKIETQYVLHERVEYDLQNLIKGIWTAERDWVQLEIDKSGNIRTLFEPPTPDELERLKTIQKNEIANHNAA